MSDELARLRADLEAMERYECYSLIENARCDVADKIAKLEAAADPWRKAKSAVEYFRGFAPHKVAEHDVVKYVDHLTAEVARLTARAKSFDSDLERARKKCNELYEAKRNAESQRDTALNLLAELESVEPVSDMQPPSEGPIVGIEPVLDPARVLATAAVRLDEMHISGGAYLRSYTDGAKPYRMCERSVSIAFVDDLEVEPKRAIATAKNIIEAAGWLKTANDLKRFLAEMGGSGSIPYRTKGETNELA